MNFIRRYLGSLIRCMGIQIVVRNAWKLLDLNLTEALNDSIVFTASLLIFFIIEYFVFDNY